MSRKIEKVAIANRGEVAVRIIRACQEMGLDTVLLHSEADEKTLAYRLADEVVCIGGAEVSSSYLNIASTIQGARSAAADAIHPGFGFLSENAEFAKACLANRLIFIGPSPQSIELFGDKISAKKLVEQAGGPIIPGYQGEDQSLGRMREEVSKIGYPVIVKAAGGGGGRGLRVVGRESQLEEAVQSAAREGLAAFGSERLFLEKYLGRAKHVEIQIFGAADGEIFHLYERECSVQRRHQKVIEEAPASLLDFSLRESMAQAAVRIAQAAKYKGAGTVEFLVQDGQFYFLEMNTRLQVEHPVTELVMGVDLVKAQLQTAMDQSLYWMQDELFPRGHSIECRIYAEDAYANGVPSTGVLGSCVWPRGPGRRFEVGFEAGDEVTPYYDSMIAKVVTYDETRARAIEKMRQTLKDTIIFGVKTNIPYLLSILSHPEFVEGSMTTGFIAANFPKGIEAKPISSTDRAIIDEVNEKVAESSSAMMSEGPDAVSPWKYQWSHK